MTDPWLALGENIRKHLLMFNWRGDPNGRHNLPGAPMLDTLVAVLMVLGVAYSLRRVLEPRYALLLLWLAFTLLGGILSLDFESPQSHRANGALTAAYLLAVVPLAVLLRAWRLSGGRYYPRAVLAPLALALALVGYANYQTYFVAQANDFAVWNAFSTPETIAARLLKELDPAHRCLRDRLFRRPSQHAVSWRGSLTVSGLADDRAIAHGLCARSQCADCAER